MSVQNNIEDGYYKWDSKVIYIVEVLNNKVTPVCTDMLNWKCWVGEYSPIEECIDSLKSTFIKIDLPEFIKYKLLC